MTDRVRSEKSPDARPKIGLKYLIQVPNRQQMVNAVDEALDLGAHYVQFKFLEDSPLALKEGRNELLTKMLERVRRLPPGTLNVDILPGYGGPRQTDRCKMSVLHPLIDWDGQIYMCAFFHHRIPQHGLGNNHDRGFFAHWGTNMHCQQIREVDPSQCVPNCPLLRYNPVVEFIKQEGFRFRFI